MELEKIAATASEINSLYTPREVNLQLIDIASCLEDSKSFSYLTPEERSSKIALLKSLGELNGHCTPLEKTS
ncbi:MAG: hypothetical protein ACRBFS_22875 [Aureispira sp.]